jgi:hypothetical protein
MDFSGIVWSTTRQVFEERWAGKGGVVGRKFQVLELIKGERQEQIQR